MDSDARNILDQAGLGVLITDREHRVQQANRTLLDWVGHAETELLGHDVTTIVGREERARLQDQLSQLWHGDAAPCELALADTSGDTVRVCMHPVGLRDESGSPIGGLVLLSRLPTNGTGSCALNGVSPHAGVHDGNGPPRPIADGAKLTARADLTRRQAQIFDLLALGRPTAMIAETLNISSHTVRNHVKAIYSKLGLHSRTEFLRRFGR